MVSRYWWLVSLLWWLAGCSHVSQPQAQSSADNTSHQASKVSSLPPDDQGRPIVLTHSPQRIITIGPGLTETIFVLGAGKRLVGRDQISDYPAKPFPSGIINLPIVANYSGPFFEKVVAVRPDFIIVQGETYDKARLDAWQEKCGAPVAGLGAHSLTQEAEDIEKLGAWLGNLDAARKLAAPIRLLSKASANKAPATNHTFFEVSRAPLWAAGSGTLIDDVMRAAGCDNIAHEVQGYRQYNLETLMAKQPQFYVVAQQKPDAKQVLQELRQDPNLKNLDCIRAGRVIALHADWVERPGPRLVLGVAELKSALQQANKK